LKRVVCALDVNAHEQLDALLAPFAASLDVQSFVPRATRCADGAEAALLERLIRTGNSPVPSTRARPSGIAMRRGDALDREREQRVSA